MTKEWKRCQEQYHRLVRGTSDDLHSHRQVIDDEKVDHAMFYLMEKADFGIYPAKSRMIAIIYATMINKVYGDEFYSTLDDPDLVYGKDRHFVPYSEDRKTYDTILDILRGLPNWIQWGWGPVAVEYWRMECTQQGIDKINGILCDN